jgi:hypothetical protein
VSVVLELQEMNANVLTNIEHAFMGLRLITTDKDGAFS